MFCNFRSKIRVCGNRCHTLSFKDEDNRKMPVDAEKNKLQNCYLKIFEIVTILEKKLRFFSTFFYFFKKIPQNFKILKKRNLCT